MNEESEETEGRGSVVEVEDVVEVLEVTRLRICSGCDV